MTRDEAQQAVRNMNECAKDPTRHPVPCLLSASCVILNIVALAWGEWLILKSSAATQQWPHSPVEAPQATITIGLTGAWCKSDSATGCRPHALFQVRATDVAIALLPVAIPLFC